MINKTNMSNPQNNNHIHPQGLSYCGKCKKRVDIPQSSWEDELFEIVCQISFEEKPSKVFGVEYDVIPEEKDFKRLKNFIAKERKSLLESLLMEETNFNKYGKSKMCWQCSYWGKDCKCKSNKIVQEQNKKIRELLCE